MSEWDNDTATLVKLPLFEVMKLFSGVVHSPLLVLESMARSGFVDSPTGSCAGGSGQTGPV